MEPSLRHPRTLEPGYAFVGFDDAAPEEAVM
jgi:hypothetical protein